MSAPTPSNRVGKSSDRRKLIAVVYADMVGFSRLIGLDDVGTLERLRSLRRNVIDPAIEEHGGRIVQTGGDSLLIVFDSIDGWWCGMSQWAAAATSSLAIVRIDSSTGLSNAVRRLRRGLRDVRDRMARRSRRWRDVGFAGMIGGDGTALVMVTHRGNRSARGGGCAVPTMA